MERVHSEHEILPAGLAVVGSYETFLIRTLSSWPFSTRA